MPNEVMDVVNEVTDTISDVANSTNSHDVLKGGLIGGAVVAAGFAAYRFLIKPLVKKAKLKVKVAKAKRAVRNDDVPEDIEEEYPIGK